MSDEPPPGMADPASDPFEVAAAAAAALRERTGVDRHDFAVVLGSGWAGADEGLGRAAAVVAWCELPGFAPASVPGQSRVVDSVPGQSRVVRSVQVGATGTHALVFAGRTHLYEGRGVRAVAHPVRVAAAAGCRLVVLTNGCGGLTQRWAPGTIALVSDHINLTGRSPVEGPVFVDLTDLYSARLRALAREADPMLAEGVYVQVPGPHYETPAEVRMARRLGGDLVGMSTALEAIAARQCGVQVLGLGLVTNLAAGVSPRPLSHEEVLQTGRAAAARCRQVLADVVALATATP